MTLWHTFKSLPLVKLLIAIATAIALVLLGAKVQSKKRAVKKKETREQQRLADGSSKAIQKAKKIKESAQKDLDTIAAAKVKMRKKLDTIGEADEDLDELMDRFNSERVRKPSG